MTAAGAKDPKVFSMAVRASTEVFNGKDGSNGGDDVGGTIVELGSKEYISRVLFTKSMP